MPLGLFCVFFGGHLPQTSGFRSAKQIIIMSSTTQVRARIWSDRNIFCTLGEGQQWQGLMPLGLFLVFLVVTCPGLPSAKQIRAASFRSTLAMSPVV